MNALLLIDIQNDFVPGGALAVREGEAIVPLVNELQPLFDLVVATQDWHPAEHGSFAANHEGRQPGELIELHGLPQILWPVHCVQGSEGAEFVPGLDQTRWARIFTKGSDPAVDSYSGFFDNGHRHATGLGDYLHGSGVETVYLAGLATDYCVKFTALDALGLGFRVVVIEDACRGVELQPGDVAKALEAMRKVGIEVLSASEVKAKLGQTGEPIRFYKTGDPYGAFSNFAAYPFEIEGKHWPTTEHFFQGQKFPGTAHEEEIRLTKSPMIAARLGRTREVPLRNDWESVKEQIMKTALQAKFSQHPELREMLLGTGNAELIEHTRNDAYWRDGGDGKGQNRLGALLMEIRAELRNQSS